MKKRYFFIVGTIIGILVFLSLTIALNQATLGDTVTLSNSQACKEINEDGYSVSVPADTDASDGFINYLYGSYALKSPSGIILEQGNLEQIPHGESGYSANATFVADEFGRYYFRTVIFYAKQEFNLTSGNWTTTDSGTCSSSFGDYVRVTYPQPDVQQILDLVNDLFQSWIGNL